MINDVSRYSEDIFPIKIGTKSLEFQRYIVRVTAPVE